MNLIDLQQLGSRDGVAVCRRAAATEHRSDVTPTATSYRGGRNALRRRYAGTTAIVGDFAQSQFPHLLAEWGYGAILVAVVADSFGLPIPGEAMLILASIYAGASHHLLLPFVMGAAAAGAVFGDNITYALGYRGGYPLVRRHGERLHLGPRRLKIGQYLFRTYGRGIVFVGRLIPVLHIWTAVLAGVNRMSWPRFALANAVGAVTWAVLLSLAGYAFGRAAEHAGGVIAGAAVPMAIAIGLSAVLLLRLNERRLYARAEEAMGAEPEQTAGQAETRPTR